MNTKVDLTKIICSILNKNQDEIGDLSGKDMFEDMHFDSISIMELIVDVEEVFSIDLGEEELIESVSKFDTLVKLIEEKKTMN